MRVHDELLQILNMLQRQVNKYFGTKQVASARKVEHPYLMIGRMTMGDLGNQGVLLAYIIIIIIHKGNRPKDHIHAQGCKVSQVFPLSKIKGGGMSQIFCKERIRRENMLKPGFWECENIFSCTITHHMYNPELQFTIFKENHLCGGINSSRLTTLMRRWYHGASSRYISSKISC